MSFAGDVKKELMGLDNFSCCKKAMIAGILQGSSEVVISGGKLKVVIKTYLPSLLRFLLPEFKKNYEINPEISYLSKKSLNNYRVYYMEIDDKAKEIIDDFHLMPFDTIVEDDELIEKECCQSAFIRGLFIAKGSVNDPKKSSYHLEIVFRKVEIASLVNKILLENNINSKLTTRKNQTLLYIKKSEEISAFLAFIGASVGVLYFEDSRIYRDLANNVNRTMNCDIANGSKSLKYCQKQMEAINYLELHNLTSKLSGRLQDAIRLRKEYPDSSLAELGEFSHKILGKNMSKSGISHCMSEIMKYYEMVTSQKE